MKATRKKMEGKNTQHVGKWKIGKIRNECAFIRKKITIQGGIHKIIFSREIEV